MISLKRKANEEFGGCTKKSKNPDPTLLLGSLILPTYHVRAQDSGKEFYTTKDVRIHLTPAHWPLDLQITPWDRVKLNIMDAKEGTGMIVVRERNWTIHIQPHSCGIIRGIWWQK